MLLVKSKKIMMKKLSKVAFFFLLLSSQLSYASQRDRQARFDGHRISISCDRKDIIIGASACMAATGSFMTLYGAVSMRDHACDSICINHSAVSGPGPIMLSCGMVLLGVGAGLTGYFVKKFEALHADGPRYELVATQDPDNEYEQVEG